MLIYTVYTVDNKNYVNIQYTVYTVDNKNYVNNLSLQPTASGNF